MRAAVRGNLQCLVKYSSQTPPFHPGTVLHTHGLDLFLDVADGVGTNGAQYGRGRHVGWLAAHRPNQRAERCVELDGIARSRIPACGTENPVHREDIEFIVSPLWPNDLFGRIDGLLSPLQQGGRVE